MIFRSRILSSIPGIVHGFGSRDEPIPTPLRKVWDFLPEWKQVHGTDSVEVLRPSQDCGSADALFSRKPKIPISVVTADCVPILLARKDGAAVAAVHAGWRGTRAHILRRLWEKLSAQGEKPSDWVAAVGPAIGPCCYEVSEELAQDFVSEFGEAGVRAVVPRARMLDLPVINAYELRKLRIAEIEVIRACTKCSVREGEPTFVSYRRQGGGVRQWSAIAILTP